MSDQPICRVYWGSHGCDLPRGHQGPHECGCCDCPDHDANQGVRTDWDEDEPGQGEWVCVAKPPYYGPDTRFYGEDVTAQATHLRTLNDDLTALEHDWRILVSAVLAPVERLATWLTQRLRR